MNATRALVAGLGCRRGCSMAELLALLENALAQQGLQGSDLAGLASSVGKRDEPGLLQLALHLRLPITFLPNDALARYHGRLSETSAIALHATGNASVAEASALALSEVLGERRARLLLSKQKSPGATLAVAIAADAPRIPG